MVATRRGAGGGVDAGNGGSTVSSSDHRRSRPATASPESDGARRDGGSMFHVKHRAGALLHRVCVRRDASRNAPRNTSAQATQPDAPLQDQRAPPPAPYRGKTAHPIPTSEHTRRWNRHTSRCPFGRGPRHHAVQSEWLRSPAIDRVRGLRDIACARQPPCYLRALRDEHSRSRPTSSAQRPPIRTSTRGNRIGMRTPPRHGARRPAAAGAIAELRRARYQRRPRDPRGVRATAHA